VQSVFDEDQCIFIKKIIFSVLISEFPWFSLKINVIHQYRLQAWVTSKLWKGVFSHYLSMYSSIEQSVFDENQNMFIKNNVFSVGQWVSLIFHENKRNLTIVIASMSDIKNIKMCVFIQSEYVFFNGIMCF